ncbi:1-acylglycerol-3-phosphate O-acyltransferase [Streptomyces davaonensis JCM 4913]|uniref:1-acylglycerol-3-phosphate O-acyltransferase n=1 Tax=Streptomyces davaonensis (strain DSM 101723 / JCM 4913 / KCC S-0913 / 768) TaxID=1214101 RepID=K4QY26_STRDJ|nr:lysophospholipid acyltransferase family protein [Streptomyces davaonensis]CCK25760.1 1-acylglycerol-3-phosphate O-acyltransferase [Streptomyces davaonensis JCM 4913]
MSLLRTVPVGGRALTDRRARRAAAAAVPRPIVPTSAWLPTAPCSPQVCVASARSLADVPRAVLRIGALLVTLLVGVGLLPVFGLVPVSRRNALIRGWSRAVVRAAGVRVRITGTAAPTGGLLLVANHISWLDIPLLAAVRPARMLAKAEIRRWPVAGGLTAASGAFFIERDRLRALPDTVARIAGALRSGAAVVAFPEGSTWCGRAQGHFRRAVFQAALDAGVPVQPVRLHYRFDDGPASTAPAFVGEDSLLASLWRVVTARRLVAEVEVRSEIPADAHTDRRTLAHAAEPGPSGGELAWAHAALATHQVTKTVQAAVRQPG